MLQFLIISDCLAVEGVMMAGIIPRINLTKKEADYINKSTSVS